MAISDKIDRMTASVNRAGDSLARLNDEIDRAAATEFTTAPASFSPPPTPGAPGSPSNPLPSSPFTPPRLFGPDGSPVRTIRSSSGEESSGGSGGGSRFKLADNPLVQSLTPGAILLYRSDLEGFVASGVCEIMELPSGGSVISCPWGLYPSFGGGVLQSTSASSSGGQTNLSGRNIPHPGSRGFDNLDRSRRFNSTRIGTGSAPTIGSSGSFSSSGASSALSVSLDSKPITERLDGLRVDIRELGRAISGDGGAGIRLRGGL